MSQPIKAVAEGVTEDIAKLLRSFAELQTPDFPAFASLWKDHKFSLIFMGRPDDVELTEFTNEAFKAASQFLLSSSFFFEVGAIFLLYGLYRNQISDPPIKIRIELRHWSIIDEVRKEAAQKSYRSLHYVIDYLIENAFVYVYQQVLKGPVIANVRAEPRKSEAYSSIKTTYKSDITEYMTTNSFKLLNDVHNQYVDMKKKLDEQIKLNRNAQKNVYAKFLKDLEVIAKSGCRTSRRVGKTDNEEESIGARRAKIKAQSFSNKSSDFWRRNADDDEGEGEEEEEDDEEEQDLDEPKYQFKKLHGRRARARARAGTRTVKREKRVGRPRKIPLPPQPEESNEIKEDIWVDINELPDDRDEFFIPMTKEYTASGRRIRASRFHYYSIPSKPKEEKEEENEEENIDDVAMSDNK